MEQNHEQKKQYEESERSVQNEGKFGYFGFTPSWLQWLNNPWSFLVGIFGLMFGQAFAVLGILSIVMPQIEKRFNFSSLDVGLIAAANDVPAVIFGLMISHYGNNGNKVKWIGFGGIITGLGFIIFTIPHYIIDSYDPPPLFFPAFFCIPAPPANANSPASGGCNEGFIAEWYYLALLLIGQFIAGVGTVALYTFPPKCFHESVSDKHLPLFLGIWQGAAFIGPLVAFGVSEPLLELYVDIDQPEGFNMTPKDLRWIGNWWLGFLAASFLCFLSALFMLGFPAKVAGRKVQPAKPHEESEVPDNSTTKENLRELWCGLKELLTNWTFVFNCLGVNSTLINIEGLAPFIAKILILQYGVAIEKVGVALTIATAPPVIIGVLGGSLLVSTFKINESGKRSALLCFILQIFTIIGPLAFVIPGCDEINLAGLREHYGTRTGFGKTYNFTEYPAVSGIELGSTCNQQCGCHLGIAFPVCGSDNITYLSPCYAACSGIKSMTSFTNCTCIASQDGYGGTAEFGYCDRDCKNWLLFLIVLSLVSLVFFLQISPSKVVVLRCVPIKRISLAFGLQYMSMKIFAHIPGPILFGHVVDLNCAIWQRVCDKTGYCWIYNLEDKRHMIVTITGTLAGIGILLFLVSWIVYKEADHDTAPKDEIKPKPGMYINNQGYEIDGAGKGVEDTIM